MRKISILIVVSFFMLSLANAQSQSKGRIKKEQAVSNPIYTIDGQSSRDTVYQIILELTFVANLDSTHSENDTVTFALDTNLQLSNKPFIINPIKTIEI